MTKKLYKEIMKQSRLRNQHLKSKSLTDRKHISQGSFCKKLLRTTRKEYVNNLDTKKVSGNRTFLGLLLLFSQTKFQKVIKLSYMKIAKLFQLEKNYAELAALIFQT